MKKVLKWIGIVLGSLLVLLLLAAVGLYFFGSKRLNKIYNLQVETIPIPNDEASIARGQHLSQAITLCQECHGDNFEGTVIDNEPSIAVITAPNLTSGVGGIAATYTDADWVRAIRYGVDPQGRGLILMHSDIYNNLTENDLGAIISFLKSVPPVDNELPETKAEPLGQILVALGMFDNERMPLIPAELINRDAPISRSSIRDSSADYGKYLVSITVCTMCHGEDFTGRSPLEPGSPAAPDITTAGRLDGVSEQEFISLFRSRASQEGNYMPWTVYARMTDEELAAIYLYLTSLNGG